MRRLAFVVGHQDGGIDPKTEPNPPLSPRLLPPPRFREAIEASLIVGICLAYTAKTGNRRYNKRIWQGTACAILASIAVGIGLSAPYWISDKDVFSGYSQYVFEGVFTAVAAGLLTWMILWTQRMGAGLRGHLEAQLDEGLDSGRAELRLFLLPFFQIFREGVETAIFVLGLGAQDGEWKAVPLPAILGVLVAVAVSFLVFRGSIQADLVQLLTYSSVVLVFFAAGLVSYSLHELQEANWFGVYKNYGKYPGVGDTSSLPDVLRGMTAQTLWKTKSLLDDSNNEFGALVRALLGYQDAPTIMEVVGYAAYWCTVGCVVHWVTSPSHGRVVASTACCWRMACWTALVWGLVQFIWACTDDSGQPWLAFIVSLSGIAANATALSASAKDPRELIAWAMPPALRKKWQLEAYAHDGAGGVRHPVSSSGRSESESTDAVEPGAGGGIGGPTGRAPGVTSRAARAIWSRRAGLARRALVCLTLWHCFVLAAIWGQLGVAARCRDSTDLVSAYAEVYASPAAPDGSGLDLAALRADPDAPPAVVAWVEFDAGSGPEPSEPLPAAVTMGSSSMACGVGLPDFGTSFAHQFFVLNPSWLQSPREQGAWHGGSALVMALLLNLFGACFHVLSAYHVSQFYGQVAAGTCAEPEGESVHGRRGGGGKGGGSRAGGKGVADPEVGVIAEAGTETRPQSAPPVSDVAVTM